jgi:hypothetical protein
MDKEVPLDTRDTNLFGLHKNEETCIIVELILLSRQHMMRSAKDGLFG